VSQACRIPTRESTSPPGSVLGLVVSARRQDALCARSESLLRRCVRFQASRSARPCFLLVPAGAGSLLDFFCCRISFSFPAAGASDLVRSRSTRPVPTGLSPALGRQRGQVSQPLGSPVFALVDAAQGSSPFPSHRFFLKVFLALDPRQVFVAVILSPILVRFKPTRFWPPCCSCSVNRSAYDHQELAFPFKIWCVIY
jgi:hypothetical protein